MKVKQLLICSIIIFFMGCWLDDYKDKDNDHPTQIRIQNMSSETIQDIKLDDESCGSLFPGSYTGYFTLGSGEYQKLSFFDSDDSFVSEKLDYIFGPNGKYTISVKNSFDIFSVTIYVDKKPDVVNNTNSYHISFEVDNLQKDYITYMGFYKLSLSPIYLCSFQLAENGNSDAMSNSFSISLPSNVSKEKIYTQTDRNISGFWITYTDGNGTNYSLDEKYQFKLILTEWEGSSNFASGIFFGNLTGYSQNGELVVKTIKNGKFLVLIKN